ncbi:hypothetical protein CPB84DRAFT_1798641 [Gymnopilus junonius]|uniref:Uncharacterized protein n=1 Tax=Gymnopilus junonius TaxID=109634 RepID=A0A9P5TG10_GYMJU|nr:hypothetical protein CPB84DRAFT_1798641 [Gymnopilus junonius]
MPNMICWFSELEVEAPLAPLEVPPPPPPEEEEEEEEDLPFAFGTSPERSTTVQCGFVLPLVGTMNTRRRKVVGTTASMVLEVGWVVEMECRVKRGAPGSKAGEPEPEGVGRGRRVATMALVAACFSAHSAVPPTRSLIKFSRADSFAGEAAHSERSLAGITALRNWDSEAIEISG